MTYGGPRGVGVSYEQGTPVTARVWWASRTPPTSSDRPSHTSQSGPDSSPGVYEQLLQLPHLRPHNLLSCHDFLSCRCFALPSARAAECVLRARGSPPERLEPPPIIHRAHRSAS